MFPFVSNILSEFTLLIWIFYAYLERLLVSFFKGSYILYSSCCVLIVWVRLNLHRSYLKESVRWRERRPLS